MDELGAISPHPPSTQVGKTLGSKIWNIVAQFISQVESPRSTLLRYGLSYKPYDFTKDQEHQVVDIHIDGNNVLPDVRRRTHWVECPASLISQKRETVLVTLASSGNEYLLVSSVKSSLRCNTMRRYMGCLWFQKWMIFWKISKRLSTEHTHVPRRHC